MAGEASTIEPKISSIHLKGSLNSTFDSMANRLSSLQMFSIKNSADSLIILRVESRNIQKKPFLFFIFTFRKDGVDIDYSIGEDSSSKIRRLYVLKNFIAVLSLVTDLYEIDSTDVFQLLDSGIDDVIGSLSQSYGSLFNSYDSLFNKYREIRRLNIELSGANKNLSVQASMLSSENAELKERLKSLETYSDTSLISMIEDWIESHDGTIDINEFANAYKIIPPRVEQVLNKMVSMGYVELKG